MTGRIIPAAGCYVALAFGAGFVVGPVRELVLAPAIGATAALAVETPIMALVSWLAARWTAVRFAVPSRVAARLRMGLLALGMLVALEEGTTRLLRGGSIFAHWADQPGAEQLLTVVGLLLFLAMPALITLRLRPRAGGRVGRR